MREPDIQSASSVSAELIAQSYGEMRALARKIISSNSLARVIQPTELANEAVIRLLRARIDGLDDKGRLLAISARTMRRILVDEARKASSAKRSVPTTWTYWPNTVHEEPVDLLLLDAALDSLASVSPERAEIVDLRFMLGMTVEEAAVSCGLSERTVKRYWQSARAWLIDYMGAAADACDA